MLAKTKQAKSGGMFCHESTLLIQLKKKLALLVRKMLLAGMVSKWLKPTPEGT